MAAEATLLSVAKELSKEVTSLGAIDEWLEARGIDPLEMRAFIDTLGDRDGKVGFYVQVGYELAARRYGAVRP